MEIQILLADEITLTKLCSPSKQGSPDRKGTEFIFRFIHETAAAVHDVSYSQLGLS